MPSGGPVNPNALIMSGVVSNGSDKGNMGTPSSMSIKETPTHKHCPFCDKELIYRYYFDHLRTFTREVNPRVDDQHPPNEVREQLSNDTASLKTRVRGPKGETPEDKRKRVKVCSI